MRELILEFLQAKIAEAEATAKRVALAEQIAAKLGAPDEGSKTHTVGAFKVTVKQPVNRKVDWKAFDLAHAAFPDKPAPVVTKRELDVPGMRWCQENEPAFYQALAKAITATPGRVAIDIKETES